MKDLIGIFLGIFISVIVILSVFVVVLIVPIWAYQQYYQNIPTKCWVNGRLVYSGSSAGIDISSSGAATTVMVRGGFLYLWPMGNYVSSSVTMEGTKR